MKTFEDNEIIKALECCLSGKDYDTACMKCPIEPICESDDILFKYALDLINRLQDEKQALINGQETLQKHLTDKQWQIEKFEKIEHFATKTIDTQRAEIERLKHRKTELQIRNQELQHEKSEAIKEFVERLKEHKWKTSGGFDVIDIKSIDNLVKEMTEVYE